MVAEIKGFLRIITFDTFDTFKPSICSRGMAPVMPGRSIPAGSASKGSTVRTVAGIVSTPMRGGLQKL